MVADQLDERVDQLRSAPARDRHAALLDGDRDHLRHVAGGGRVRPEAGVQHPGREEAVGALGLEGVRQPVAARDRQVAGEGRQPAPPEPAVGLEPEREAGPRPELGAEDPEGEVRVREERVQHLAPAGAVRRRRSPRRSRCRNALSPSGNAVAVGSSVFRYSSPRAASSSPSSACAAPPTQSGCQALNTSWRYPASVSSAVWTAPPRTSSRSRTRTSPARARQQRRAGQRVDPAPDDDRVTHNLTDI